MCRFGIVVKLFKLFLERLLFQKLDLLIKIPVRLFFIENDAKPSQKLFSDVAFQFAVLAVFDFWDVGRIQNSFLYFLPGHIRQPLVFLDFLCAVVPEAVLWDFLDQFIYKIRRRYIPPFGTFSFFHLDLFAENLVDKYFPRHFWVVLGFIIL